MYLLFILFFVIYLFIYIILSFSMNISERWIQWCISVLNRFIEMVRYAMKSVFLNAKYLCSHRPTVLLMKTSWKTCIKI